MTLLEALLKNMESLRFAAQAEWQYPVSREFLAIADLIDIYISANTEKKNKGQVKPYERPFKELPEGKRVVKGARMSVQEAVELYKPKTANKTPEQIAEANRKFLKKQKEEG